MRTTRDIAVQPLPHITYAARGDTLVKEEASILANIYALALQKHKDRNETTRPGSPADVNLRNVEEVSNVEGQPS